MYKVFSILLVTAMLSLGVTFPGLIYEDQSDSTIILPIDDDALRLDLPVSKPAPKYDIPKVGGEPLPPPADDDEPIMAELGPQ